MAKDIAARVAYRYVDAANDGLVLTLIKAQKLLEDLDSWVKEFPALLRKAEQGADGLPSGWVWQDLFVSYLTRYDERFVTRFQDVSYALEGHWLDLTGKLQQAVGRVRGVVKEPSGKASVMYPTQSFQFLPHPERGESIAYKVADLTAWAHAFSQWVDNGQKVVSDTMKLARKAP